MSGEGGCRGRPAGARKARPARLLRGLMCRATALLLRGLWCRPTLLLLVVLLLVSLWELLAGRVSPPPGAPASPTTCPVVRVRAGGSESGSVDGGGGDHEAWLGLGHLVEDPGVGLRGQEDDVGEEVWAVFGALERAQRGAEGRVGARLDRHERPPGDARKGGGVYSDHEIPRRLGRGVSLRGRRPRGGALDGKGVGWME